MKQLRYIYRLSFNHLTIIQSFDLSLLCLCLVSSGIDLACEYRKQYFRTNDTNTILFYLQSTSHTDIAEHFYLFLIKLYTI